MAGRCTSSDAYIRDTKDGRCRIWETEGQVSSQEWSLHNSLDTSNCIDVLKTAISRYGTPEILNSDQGCQFTSKEWADACAEYPEMKASMDGRGRAKDNIWIERFWKTIKYEYFYILPEENGADLFFGINRTVSGMFYFRQADWP